MKRSDVCQKPSTLVPNANAPPVLRQAARWSNETRVPSGDLSDLEERFEFRYGEKRPDRRLRRHQARLQSALPRALLYENQRAEPAGIDRLRGRHVDAQTSTARGFGAIQPLQSRTAKIDARVHHESRRSLEA